MSHVAWSVCLCAVQKGRTDRDAVWGADSCGPKEPFIRWGRDPPRERAIWGLSGPLGVCCGLRSNGIIQNNGTTAGLLQPTAVLRTGWCHITLSPVKNPPPAMWPSSKIFTTCYYHRYYFIHISIPPQDRNLLYWPA